MQNKIDYPKFQQKCLQHAVLSISFRSECFSIIYTTALIKVLELKIA